LHYGHQAPDRWSHERLFGEVLLPICNKTLIPGRKKRCSSRDIASHVLLHSIRRPSDWPQWFDAAGLTEFSAAQELTFENSTMTYQGAVEGLGIAIAQKALVADEIASGRLVAPSSIEVRTEAAYYFVFPNGNRTPAKVQAFHRWIADEASATRQAVPSL
jgi:LysR family transcriptional regulator, glycine cleavage system transcriptional activator